MTDHSNTTPVLKQPKGYGKYGLNSIIGDIELLVTNS